MCYGGAGGVNKCWTVVHGSRCVITKVTTSETERISWYVKKETAKLAGTELAHPGDRDDTPNHSNCWLVQVT